jgi:hypothetical protein
VVKPSDIARVGCIVCRHYLGVHTEPELHHCRILGGKRELAQIIPLCTTHHRTGSDSLHRAKATFRANYGTEAELVHLTLGYLAEIKRNTIGG